MRRDLAPMRSSSSNPGLRGQDMLPHGLTGYKQRDLVYSHKRRISRVRAEEQNSLFAKLVRGADEGLAASAGDPTSGASDVVVDPSMSSSDGGRKIGRASCRERV